MNQPSRADLERALEAAERAGDERFPEIEQRQSRAEARRLAGLSEPQTVESPTTFDDVMIPASACGASPDEPARPADGPPPCVPSRLSVSAGDQPSAPNGEDSGRSPRAEGRTLGDLIAEIPTPLREMIARDAVRDYVASLAQERDALKGRELDNHHNAVLCPYCNPALRAQPPAGEAT